MADSPRDDNAAPCNKRAARSEKTVIVGKQREEKDDEETRKRRSETEESRQRRRSLPYKDDRLETIVAVRPNPSDPQRDSLTMLLLTSTIPISLRSLPTSFSVALPEEDVRRCSLSVHSFAFRTMFVPLSARISNAQLINNLQKIQVNK
ncbi:hypothetical protein ALC56_02100 [Trachymyrmex septentrionalis]|uniref:Uncharacterized protein n=1 Tax=Trachymyrmex septentrionalis TaxID=34720 RepID=A0A195FU10_9HYME|nr:hypothetical protein ALC56_02100 [Trachymyrmex septentrionalis]